MLTTNYDTKLIDIDKLEIDNLPDGIKVATMCASCFLGTKICLDNIEKLMELDKEDILAIKRNTNSVRTLIELKKASKRTISNKDKQLSNNFYNSITLIVRVTSGATDNLNTEAKINVKLFKNGSLQMSGCKNINNINIVLHKILNKLNKDDINFVEEKELLGINKFKIDMIYCNYKITIQIDREKLYDLLKKKKVKCIYEPCIRACVTIKYTPSADNKDNKEVSIFIFKKGNIIITGAKSKNQIIESYNYINNIFITHSDDIIKKSDEVEEDIIMKLYNDILVDAEKGLITIDK
jgi:TATA-box binding protein (TBP) (component of TFIID and TFIIIB)